MWDAATGQPAGAPLQHKDAVTAAAFSPDGRRVVTASRDKTARVWQVLLDLGSGENVRLFADLAEVVGGYRVADLGSVVPLTEPERLQRVRRIVGPGTTAFVQLDVLLRPWQLPSRQ